MINSGFPNSELIHTAHSVAKLRSMDYEVLCDMLEYVLRETLAKYHYGLDSVAPIIVKIDRHTGAIDAFLEYQVICDTHYDDVQRGDDTCMNNDGAIIDSKQADLQTITTSESALVSEVAAITQTQRHSKISRLPITVTDAKLRFGGTDVEVVIGAILTQRLPYTELTRNDMRIIRRSLLAGISQYERKKQHQLFSNRIGEIVHGIVEKMIKGDALVRITGGVALLPRDKMLPTDHFTQGDKIKGVIDHLDEHCELSQVILSRTSDDFLIQLFGEYVPQVAEGIIVIPAIARQPGHQSKVAVYTTDTINPIGACVGVRATRLREITNELNNEKVDLVLWSSDTMEFVANALIPIHARKIVVDKNKRAVSIMLDDKDLSAAIGRGGQNVRLLSSLLNMSIDIYSASDYAMAEQESALAQEGAADNEIDRKARFSRREQRPSLTRAEMTQHLMQRLDVDYSLAEILVDNGYLQIGDIATASPINFLANVEGMSDEIGEELISRAQEYAATYPSNNTQLADTNSNTDGNGDEYEPDELNEDEGGEYDNHSVFTSTATEGFSARSSSSAVSSNKDTDVTKAFVSRRRGATSDRRQGKFGNDVDDGNITDASGRHSSTGSERDHAQVDEYGDSMADIYARLKRALILARCRTVQQIADLSTDELLDIAERYDVALSESEASRVIMQARGKTYFKAYKPS